MAARAGVSVGTLYQYFPNKGALLQAALTRHLNGVTEAVEQVCLEQKANTLAQMGVALVSAFLEAKMRNGKTSVALYALSSDVGGAKIMQKMGKRSNQAIVEMLKTACDPLARDPRIVASMLQGAMGRFKDLLAKCRALPEKPNRANS